MRHEPTIVVLAAGQGRRFRSAGHKLEQPLGPRASVLACTLEHALAAGLPVLVVTTGRLEGLASGLVARRDLLILPDEQAWRGVGHTIAAGVAERPDSPGWLVLPGDMPLVQPQSIRAVAVALDEHAVAYSQYRGRRGHPVGFGSELYPELVALSGDEGARRVVARYPGHGVEVDDPGVLVDIDTVEDLAAASARVGTTPAAVSRT